MQPSFRALATATEVIDADRSSAQKERRIIDTLEPVLNEHKLVLNKALILRDYKSTENLPSEEVNRYRWRPPASLRGGVRSTRQP